MKNPKLHEDYSEPAGTKSFTAAPRGLEAINRHVNDGTEGGSFTEALLANDLRSAIFTADPENRENIYAYVSYLQWCVPSSCWGSVRKVNEWRRGMK